MSDTTRSLYLLDGMALAYRAYFALITNPRINSNGVNTSAPFGFINSLLEIIKNRQPTHLAVAFDTSDPTFRHEQYPPYKAQRQAMPEDLSASLPWVRKIIEAMNIPVLICPGYEADDIIGTLVRRAEKDGFNSWMVTPDKDFAQLVSDKTTLYRLASGRQPDLMGPAEVCEKWGVQRVEQIIDILGLQGDASDNIPGVPSVGPKTAQKLLAAHDSVEGVVAAAHTVKGKLGEKLVAFSDQAILSKELATIHCEVPIEVNWDDLALTEPNEPVLREILAELELRTATKRIFGDDATAVPKSKKKSRPADGQMEFDLFGDGSADDQETEETVSTETIASTTHTYQTASTPEAIDALFAELAKVEAFAFDFETDGLDIRTVNVLGLALCAKAGAAWYVPFPNDKSEQLAILKKFERLTNTPETIKIAHHAAFDLGILKWRGIDWQGPIFDTMIADYLLHPDARHKMDEVAQRLLNYTPIPITDLIGPKGKGQKTLAEVPLEKVADYAAEDADVTFRIAEIQQKELADHDVKHLYYDIEAPLISVLQDMSRNGVSINCEALATYSEELGTELASLTSDIYEMANTEFNIDSPKQLGDVLFEKLELSKKPKKTRTGQYATGEEILRKLAPKHEIVAKILRYRELRKLKNTYVDTLPKHIFEETGRIHTQFDQAAAATGRMASSNPNLQNIPIRTKEGREIRRAFVPENPDHILMAADYSQIELRIIAHLSEDKGLCGAFNNGEDIHTATAARVFDVDPLFVTADMRRKAKMVNFGIAYGISAFGLSQRLNCSRSEAKEIITNYFTRFPGVQSYMDETLEFAAANGYVKTLLGRRRYLRDINSANHTVRTAAERIAINTPIQGTAADMIKIAMVRVHKALEASDLTTKLLVQVHDELVLEGPADEAPAVEALLKEHMSEALPLSVPVVIEFGTGKTWLEAH